MTSQIWQNLSVTFIYLGLIKIIEIYIQRSICAQTTAILACSNEILMSQCTAIKKICATETAKACVFKQHIY